MRKKQLASAQSPTANNQKLTFTKIEMASLPIQSGQPPLLWVDRMQAFVRSEPEVATLQFLAAMPDHQVEVCRLQTSLAHVRSIAAVLCKISNFYPERPTE